MYEIVGEIIEGRNYYYIVKTEFGLVKQAKAAFLKGMKPRYINALDPSEYFRNICKSKFPNDDINDLSEINYVSGLTKIKVTDKDYGEYWITPKKFLIGQRHKKRYRLTLGNGRRLNKNFVIEKIKSLHPDLEFTLEKYKNIDQKLLVKNRYGVCSMTIERLLSGSKPTILSAVNKTEYFIAQAMEVHGDKYDYSLVEYKGNKELVKIISKYGIFEQTSNSHLRGRGCPIEARKSTTAARQKDPTGWSPTNWEAAALKSKNFESYKVYFIECNDFESGEKFYKIGRTFKSIHGRFKTKTIIPYSFTTLKVIELPTAKETYELEQEYKNKHKEFKYIPNKNFNGMYECFSKLIKTNNGTLI